MCIRYVSLLPLVLALLGWVIGFIAGEIVEERKTVEKKKSKKKENVERLQKAREYVKKVRKMGHNDEQIKEKFREAGWNEGQIKRVM